MIKYLFPVEEAYKALRMGGMKLEMDGKCFEGLLTQHNCRPFG